MSTKTAFKRVALVAAAALAIGGLTSVVASAGTTPQINSSTSSSTASLTTGTYTAESITTGSADKYYTISSTGGTVLYPSTAPTGTTLNVSGSNEVWSNGTGAIGAGSAFAGTETLTVSVYSGTAGTQVVTLTGNSSTAITLTITWGAAAVLSASNSFVAANNAADIAATTVGTTGTTLRATAASADTSITGVGTTTNVLAGGATVGVYNNATSPVVITSDSVSASVSGPGLVAIATLSANTGTPTVGTFTSQGRSVSVAATAGYAIVKLYADGTTGTSTVTVSDSTAGVVLGTFTVTFYSNTIAKLVATTNYSVALGLTSGALNGFTAKPTEGFTGSAATTTVGAPVSVVASDANGNAIPGGATVNVSSGTTSVATVSSTATYDSTNGYYYPTITPVAEGSTVLTFTDASTGLIVATATVWILSSVVASIAASTDATSYDPGTKVLYTLTAKDAAGNPVADGSYSNLIATAPTSNVGLQGTIPPISSTTATAFVGGVNTATLYSPTATANVAIAGGVLGTTADIATAAQGATINEADFATTGSSDTAANAATDAANEATDAANAATDAANAAADSADAATQAAQDAGAQATAALAATVALSQQVTKLLAKVASLATLLAKIAKKVKA